LEATLLFIEDYILTFAERDNRSEWRQRTSLTQRVPEDFTLKVRLNLKLNVQSHRDMIQKLAP
jgi:hypothetical protein